MNEAAVQAMPSRPRAGRASSSIPISSLVGVPAWTLVAAFLLSTQFLAQPFVWANFPLESIALAWLAIFRNRLIVSSIIAAAIVAVVAVPDLPTVVRGALIAAAIAGSALLGESILSLLGYEHQAIGTTPMLLRVSRWWVIASAVATIFLLYRQASRGRTEVHEASLRATQLERQAAQSRLQLLRSQIEPHFLFNTLATIRRLHRSTPDKGATMLANFIDYLRAAMPRSADQPWFIRDESDLVRAYLHVVEVRMSGRLTWSMEVDASLAEHAFPRLALATLVENAVKHGIVPAEEGGHVAIVVRRLDSFIDARVIDTGVGLSMAGGGSGIGLANTRARLRSLYGSDATLDLAHNSPRGICASIRIPG